jgi:DHA1 family tetracycline resistance protein-like MFS transporter
MNSPVHGRHAVTFILVTILIDTIGFGIIIPVWPQLMMDVTRLSLGDAARYGGYIGTLFAVMQFIFSPVMGNLSDRFGRRPILLLSLTGLGIDFIIMGLAPNLSWLVVGRAISGVLSATYSTANAYIADVTPPEKRAGSFGLIGAAFGVGFIIGPALGGVIAELAAHPPAFLGGAIADTLQQAGIRAPFFAAAMLSLVNVLYGIFVLPESLPRERRRPFALWRANPVGALLHIRRYPIVAWLSVATFFFFMAHNVNPAIWTYYVLGKFHWSEMQIGGALAVAGFAMALVSGLLTGPVVKAIGETRAAYIGLAGAFLGFILYAIAWQGWVIFVAIPVGSIMGLAGPAIRGLMSENVPPTEQGELAGAIGMLMSLTFIFSPSLYTQTFASFSNDARLPHFPGAPYLVAAFFTIVSGFIIRFAMRRIDRIKASSDQGSSLAAQ